MSKANAKKAPRSSKQAQLKLAKMMRRLNKTKASSSAKVLGSCSRFIYCV
ncbi:hypothetical protein [Archangium lipolyticum]|nr:hypothetical protein [Archangium lipolyticum]